MSIESDASLAPDGPSEETSAPSLPKIGPFLHFALAYGVVFGVLWYIQSATSGIIDPDGYYHIRWARLLWENLPHGHLPRFTWLPLTILNEHRYVDHHFLFHILQIPFTWGPNLVAGAKASAVIYGALAILSCYALIVWQRVKYPVAWLVLLLACSGPFLFRMSLPRAPAVTVATLALALFLLFTRRYVWLAVLSFLLVWMYSLFPLVGVLAGAWAVGVYLEEGRIEWKAVAAASVGIAVGLLVNPYFPQNILLFIEHARMKVASEYEVSVGNEWYPYETWYMLTSCAVAWAAQAAGWIAMRPERREGRARTITLFLFSSFLLVLTMKSRRFVEYWPAFAILFAAFSLKPVLEEWTWATIPAGWPRRIVGAAVIVLAAGVGVAFVANVKGTRSEAAGESNPNVYKGACDWMVANTPEGSIVFNTDWDDFPMLFYHDTHNAYASGLDPTYLLHANPELSKLYEDITLGRDEHPAAKIREQFGSRYAFTDTGHKDFIRNATDDGMKIVYEDDDAVVLEVPEE